MKRFISLFTMMMFLFAGTAMAQIDDNHTVSLNIQDWSYINVLGGDVLFDVHTLNDHGSPGGNGLVKYDDHSTALEWGTNSNSQLSIFAKISNPTPSGVNLLLRTDQPNSMNINQKPFTLGSAGSFNGNLGYFVDLPATNVPFIDGINRGGGETDLRYDLYLQFYQSNEVGDFDETVTYTIGANTGT